MAENEGTNTEGTETGSTTGDQGTQAPAWTAQLPAEMQGNTAITSFKTIGELAKSHLESVERIKGHETKTAEYEGKVKDFEMKLATDYIPKPKENATDEEKSAYYKAIGRPDTPEAYEFPKIDLPEVLAKRVAVAEGRFRSDCFAAGIGSKEAGFLFKNFIEGQKADFAAAVQKQEQDRQDGVLALKTEWGSKFDENATIVNRAMEKFLTPGLKTKLEAAGVANDPDVSRFFLSLGTQIVSDTLIRSDGVRNENEAREPGKLKYPTMEQAA